MQYKAIITSVAVAIAAASPLSAALFDVTFTDNDGPQWTGVVDSATDTLTINTWNEGAGGEPYWTPNVSNLPLVFDAVTLSLGAFDVADDWDGTISSNWGFLSVLDKTEIDWNQGDFIGNSSRLGWGIAMFNNGSVIGTSNNTQNYFSFVPTSSVGNRNSIANTVTVVESTTPVPLPAGGLLLLSGVAGFVAFNRKKKCSA